MDIEAIMTTLETALNTALPSRIVTREAKDFAQRPYEDMQQGVVTIVSLGADNLDQPRNLMEMAGRLSILLLFEFTLDESAGGLAVEQAENAFWTSELLPFLKAPGLSLCPLVPQRLMKSAQRAAPNGWVSVELVYEELN